MRRPTVVYGCGEIKAWMRKLAQCVPKDYQRRIFENPPKVGSVKVFGQNGILNAAWSLTWGQLVLVGCWPETSDKVFVSVQSWEEAICALAVYGTDGAQKRAEKIARFVARKLGARIQADEQILALSCGHHCVVAARTADHARCVEIIAWIAGVRVRRRVFLVDTDVGSKSLLWAVGSGFAKRDGWRDRSRETAETAAVVEALRMVR